MTLQNRFNFIKNLIETNGIQWYLDNVLKKPEEIIIKDYKTRGVFPHDNELYYADDCSLVTCAGFK